MKKRQAGYSTPTNGRSNDQYFPDKSDGSELDIERLFLRVRSYAGMEEWACQLVPQEEGVNVWLFT